MGIVELYRVQDGLIAVFDVFYKNPTRSPNYW